MALEPAYELGDGWRKLTLYTGDVLDVLRQLPSDSIDMVLTDPPYSSGGRTAQERTETTTTAKYVQSGSTADTPDFQGDNKDQRSYGYWSALWLGQCYRIAREGSVACVFTDWRQLPITTDAFQAAGWVWRGIVVWDKGEGVRPQPGRFSNQCEYVVWGSKGKMPMDRKSFTNHVGWTYTGSQPGVIEYPEPEVEGEDWDGEWIEGVLKHPPVRSDRDDKVHIAQKPLSVIVRLMQTSIGGTTVLDPFAGSGTTLVAARRLQRGAIGIEVDPALVPVIRKRIRDNR